MRVRRGWVCIIVSPMSKGHGPPGRFVGSADPTYVCYVSVAPARPPFTADSEVGRYGSRVGGGNCYVAVCISVLAVL